MAEKTLQTRIKLLTKSYSQWQAIKDTFVPLYGEMCIVTVPASSGVVAQEPAILYKVGDGEKTFAELNYTSALAADVYAWAKKESLDWEDLDATFKGELEDFIHEKAVSVDTQYRIVPDGELAWQLQKSVDDGETWEDASGNIDVSFLEERISALEAALPGKTDRLVTAADGSKAYMFNEADGGGAKYEHADGTWSFVGVNNGGKTGNGVVAYVADGTTGEGARLNGRKDGFYYYKGTKRALTADDEIVVKGDIKGLEGGMHYIGKTELAEGETYEQAIARLLAAKSHTAEAGDIVIIEAADTNKEFIYNGEEWEEIGSQGIYATQAALEAEISAREAADTEIEAELATKIDEADTLILDCNL